MPRIEIIPKGWEGSEEQLAGNGTPTIDVCTPCAVLFIEGDPIEDCDTAQAKQYTGATVGSVDVEHPAYEDSAEMGLRRDCECCEIPLTGKDD